MTKEMAADEYVAQDMQRWREGTLSNSEVMLTLLIYIDTCRSECLGGLDELRESLAHVEGKR